jgi:hypothetical protein
MLVDALVSFLDIELVLLFIKSMNSPLTTAGLLDNRGNKETIGFVAVRPLFGVDGLGRVADRVQ